MSQRRRQVRTALSLALPFALAAAAVAAPASTETATAHRAALDGAGARELERADALRREGGKDAVPGARALYRQAIDSFTAARDSCGLRRALVGLSGLEHDSMDAAAQRAAAASALRVSCTGDLSQQALAERLLGSAYINEGDYAAGARETERAVALLERTGDAREETTALRNLGLAYEESGELERALATTRRALAGAERLGDAQLLALIRNDTALIYNARGEFAHAVDAYHQNLDAMRARPYPLAEAVAWINLGYAYGQLGEHDEAAAAYRQGAAAAAEVDCWSCLAEVEIDRGDDLLDAGDPAQAEPAYRHARIIAEAHQLLRQRAEALRGLGRCAIASQRWTEARALLESARSTLHRTHGLVNESLVDTALGDLDERVGQPAAARRDYERALALARESANETWQAIASASLARVAEESGDLDLARQRIEHAVALIESERTRINAPELRTSYFGTKRSYYALYIDVLMRLERERPGRGYAGEALRVAERARARALQDQLEERAITVRRDVEPQLLAAEAAAADRLHALAYALSRTSAADAASRKGLQREIDDASRELDAARGRIRAADPRYAELLHPARITLEEIQRQLLDRDATVLEYWLGERRSYLWVVTRDALRAFTLPPRETIDASAADLRSRLVAPASASVPLEQRAAYDASASAAALASAGALASSVLPVQARALMRALIAIVPDGGLEAIPFAVLCEAADTQPPSAQGVCPHGAAMVYLPSIDALRGLRSLPRSTAPRRALAVLADPVFRAGDARLTHRSGPASSTDALLLRAAGEAGVADLPRLPHTRDEAETIAQFMDRKDSWLALDFAASRRAALAAPWRNYSVVHFATHALLNTRHPELSGIVLSLYDRDGRPEDGFLRASDIYGLDMPADLVVLSVCDSAVGKDIGAEGPASLARALFYAGAHRVLASLWAVDDRASVAFMEVFYRGLTGRGLPATEALVAAQRAMRSSKRWRLPYYWAAYVLEGDWR